ncbi:MAG: FkbM family methyltransferase [Betaproteobacteria bacterium]
MDLPTVLKTKYAYHALLWLLQPEVVLDVGSMDGSDSKRFRRLLSRAELVAFEGNPFNFRAMVEDRDIDRVRIRVVNNLVSDTEGVRSFFVQRPLSSAGHYNRGTSSLTLRDEDGLTTEEVRLEAVRVDSFLDRDYPMSSSIALWIDVEGHAYSVLEGMSGAKDRVKLVHVEVETSQVWPGQKIESDVLRLAATMGYVPLACGSNAVQRDFILASNAWYAAKRGHIHTLLRLAKLSGPALSRILEWSSFGHRGRAVMSARNGR